MSKIGLEMDQYLECLDVKAKLRMARAEAERLRNQAKFLDLIMTEYAKLPPVERARIPSPILRVIVSAKKTLAISEKT